MSKSNFHINISRKETEDDLIEIRFEHEENQKVNFSKLVNQSKYIRDKYKYSDALYSIQHDIDKIKNEFNISEEIIKEFIEVIQDEQNDIPIEHYKDIYTLSEYFCIQQITETLDKIRDNSLYDDLNFTLQILQDTEKSTKETEMKLKIKIEKFLSNRINECLQNPKFGELSIPTISRLFEQNQAKIDSELLFEFIHESTKTRFILIKFVSLDKLNDDKLDKMIEMIKEQDEYSRMIYLSYIPFNLSLIEKLKNKYEQVLNTNNKLQDELTQEKHSHDKTQKLLETKISNLEEIKQEQERIKDELTKEKYSHEGTQKLLETKISNIEELKLEQETMKNELLKEKHSHEQTKEELSKKIENYKKTIKEKKSENSRLNELKSKLEIQNQEYEETIKNNETLINELQTITNKQEQELTRMTKYLDKYKGMNENKQQTHDIFVGGRDNYNQLGEKPNNKSKGGTSLVISPPIKLSFDHFSLLSYSNYCRQSVLVTSDLSLKVIGDNKDGRITSSLQKAEIDHFTDFCMKDGSGLQLDPVSAVCCFYGTLYMFSKTNEKERQLVLCDKDIKGGDPVFLDIGNHHPVALFGGYSHLAAICSEGEVIFINRNSVIDSPELPIESVSLPDFEKASSVACCSGSVVVLSSSGRVFSSPIKWGSNVLKFSEVEELKGKEIVCVSGTNDHCLAVSKEGLVFGRGSNDDGRLGFGEKISSVPSFREIHSLRGYKIRAAYAGCHHSLFETREGKILSCGSNNYGELLLSSGPSEKVYSPTETMITQGATFCIAGFLLSVVFIDNDPPPNTPNIRIKHYE